MVIITIVIIMIVTIIANLAIIIKNFRALA